MSVVVFLACLSIGATLATPCKSNHASWRLRDPPMQSRHIFWQHHFNHQGVPSNNNDAIPDDVTRREAAANVNPNRTIKKHVSTITFPLLALLGFSLPTFPAHAGQVRATITKVMTTSDFGISMRTSVVRGAQLIDSLDGKGEQFSDNF